MSDPTITHLTAEDEARIIAEYRAARERSKAAWALSHPSPEPKQPVAVIQRRIQAICFKCGEPFEALEAVAGEIVLKTQSCPDCLACYEAEMEKRANPVAKKTEREEAWRQLCPDPVYRTQAEGGITDMARLMADCPKLERVVWHKLGPKGLLLRGATGACKSRAMWRLMRAYFDDGDWTIAALTSGSFARECQDAAGAHGLTAWFDRLAGVAVFFLDDLGRVPWTGYVWGQFFELIDHRAKNQRPFFITTNESGKTLASKCADPVTWMPLYRRLIQNTVQIVL